MTRKTKLIRRINPEIVHDNKSIDSFDRQLFLYKSNAYKLRLPLVVSDNSSSLSYLFNEGEKELSFPIVINASTIDKFAERHPNSLLILADIEYYLENSLFAFDSKQFETSRVVVLDTQDPLGYQMVCICRIDKTMGSQTLTVNEITSVYEKKALINLANETFNLGGMFYKNKKTEAVANRFSTQLSEPLAFALSNKYYRQKFTKNQVEYDLNKNMVKAKQMLHDLKNKPSQDQNISKKSNFKRREDRDLER